MFFKKKKLLKPSDDYIYVGIPWIGGQPKNSIRAYIRRDTSDRWSELNPVLRKYELAYEIDTQRIAMGDGESCWNDLAKATFK